MDEDRIHALYLEMGLMRERVDGLSAGVEVNSDALRIHLPGLEDVLDDHAEELKRLRVSIERKWECFVEVRRDTGNERQRLDEAFRRINTLESLLTDSRQATYRALRLAENADEWIKGQSRVRLGRRIIRRFNRYALSGFLPGMIAGAILFMLILLVGGIS